MRERKTGNRKGGRPGCWREKDWHDPEGGGRKRKANGDNLGSEGV